VGCGANRWTCFAQCWDPTFTRAKITDLSHFATNFTCVEPTEVPASTIMVAR
jgi:hypothetical protein